MKITQEATHHKYEKSHFSKRNSGRDHDHAHLWNSMSSKG